MNKLPEPLENLVKHLSRLPGMGPKSSLRCALAILKLPQSEAQSFGRTIYNLHDDLAICRRCGSLASQNPCPICADPSRSKDTLCLVSEWDSLLTLEEGGFYRGQYMLLGGLISPLDNMPPEALELELLRSRLREGEISEVVLALGATVEADTTAQYIKDLISREFAGVRVFRLAQGIPQGGEVKHMDRETLRQSLKYKQEL
ncbi:MAG: recombination protein RecR [Desulfovibrionaceae bacterium]|nr:recombination protein RecR [Desulfovibrionaceae bacterium]